MTAPFALIIEDEPQLAEIFSIAVQRAGFTIKLIYNGNTALTQLEEIKPDLVVLDLHLPEVSGEEILQHIQADKRLAHTKVIIATADLLKANKLRDEADLVLLKPIDIYHLRIMATRFLPL